MREMLSAVLPFLFLISVGAFFVWRGRSPTPFQSSLSSVQVKQLAQVQRSVELTEQNVQLNAEIARHLDRIATALEQRKP